MCIKQQTKTFVFIQEQVMLVYNLCVCNTFILNKWSIQDVSIQSAKHYVDSLDMMMNSKLDCESVSQESRYYNKQCRCIKSNKTLVRQYAINKDTNLVCKSFIYSFPKIKQRSQLFFTQFPSRQTGVNRCGMTSTSWQHRIGLHFTKSLFSTKVANFYVYVYDCIWIYELL